jgi:hydrogenase/urease accessory protein HupE
VRLDSFVLVIGLAAAALGMHPRAAHAHTQPYSYVDLRLGTDEFTGSVTAHVVDIAQETGISNPEDLLDEVTLASATGTIETALARRLAVSADGKWLPLDWDGTPEIHRAKKTVTFRWSTRWPHKPGRLEVRCRLFPYDPQHETYLNIYEADALKHQDLIRGAHIESTYFPGGVRGHWAILRAFVGSGVHHIFLGPDHILFLLGLLLLGGSFRRLLKIVTCFTIAHSLTLALATLHILNPPSSIVEPAIAASIIAIGAENLTASRIGRDRRAWLAFLFGFVHGFGFASVLRELGLPRNALAGSLLAFNVGVEIGQATILMILAVPLALLRTRSPKFGKIALTFGSVAVILAGGYWLIERTL